MSAEQNAARQAIIDGLKIADALSPQQKGAARRLGNKMRSEARNVEKAEHPKRSNQIPDAWAAEIFRAMYESAESQRAELIREKMRGCPNCGHGRA